MQAGGSPGVMVSSVPPPIHCPRHIPPGPACLPWGPVPQLALGLPSTDVDWEHVYGFFGSKSVVWVTPAQCMGLGGGGRERLPSDQPAMPWPAVLTSCHESFHAMRQKAFAHWLFLLASCSPWWVQSSGHHCTDEDTWVGCRQV